jgi:hypothetical protein
LTTRWERVGQVVLAGWVLHRSGDNTSSGQESLSVWGGRKMLRRRGWPELRAALVDGFGDLGFTISGGRGGDFGVVGAMKVFAPLGQMLALIFSPRAGRPT